MRRSSIATELPSRSVRRNSHERQHLSANQAVKGISKSVRFWDLSDRARTIRAMVKVAAEIPSELSRQIDRIIRDGWFPDQETVLREALSQFVDAKSFLGDSPRMLRRFAADALNDSKPEVALKFTDRALSLLSSTHLTDFTLYQALIEMRVQILLVLDRPADALRSLEEAREHLPNNPTIARWIERLEKKQS
jgi:Arc/MetJ-type ribon-helix-helix transcriptional regulator